jgi:hypothetical protein
MMFVATARAASHDSNIDGEVSQIYSKQFSHSMTVTVVEVAVVDF